MKPKGTNWCKISDNKKETKNGPLWQLMYNNGVLGGWIGEDVVLPNGHMCSIGKDCVIESGCCLVGQFFISNTKILKNTTLETSSYNGAIISDSILSGSIYIKKGVVEDSKLFGDFKSYSNNISVTKCYTSKTSRVLLSEDVVEAMLDETTIGDFAKITCSNDVVGKGKVVFNIVASKMFGHSEIYMTQSMDVKDSVISDYALIFNANLNNCSIIDKAQIAYAKLENCDFDCSIGYALSGAVIEGAKSIVLNDVHCLNDKKHQPIFIDIGSDFDCVGFFYEKGKDIVSAAFFGSKDPFSEFESVPLLPFVNIEKINKETANALESIDKREQTIVIRKMNYFVEEFELAIKSLFNNSKVNISVISNMFAYEHYLVLKNYCMEITRIKEMELYDNPIRKRAESLSKHLKMLDSFTKFNIEKGEIDGYEEKYIITKPVLNAFEDKVGAIKKFNTDKRFVLFLD